MTPLPFRPRDWVQDGGDRVARVRSCYMFDGEVYFDLVMYDRRGNCIGRESPAERGPRTFEPCCSIEGWRRIAEPSFPLALVWVREDGKRIARYWGGETLPPANWAPPKRRFKSRLPDDRYRKALVEIADGHNDARQLAKDVLGIRKDAAG